MGQALERLFLVGLSHKTAPVEVRELFAFDDESAVALLRIFRERLGAAEAVLLSTCNRTEVYVVLGAGKGLEPLRTAIVREVAAAKGRPGQELDPFTYCRTGLEAVQHLFRVAASLDSLVVGEAQILGQVRNAYRIAQAAGSLGPLLSRVFERAFKAAKQVRTMTAVGRWGVSVGSVAVDLAKKVFGDLGRCSVLLIGAGKMGEAVARALAAAGARKVVVANRTIEKAEQVASLHGWDAATLEGLEGLLVRSDAVIASVAYPGYLMTRALLKKVVAARRFAPVFIVDIGVPRVVEPEAANLEAVYLYDIDDFNTIISEHLRRRKAEVEAAEAIIAKEAASMQRFLVEQEIQPVVASLMKFANAIKEQEVSRAVRELGLGDQRQIEIVQAMASSIVKKLLHNPVLYLRQSALEGRREVIEAAVQIFGLDGLGEDETAEDADEGRR